MSGTYEFYFGQPWWLLACGLVVPVVWLARRSLGGLGKTRQIVAVVLRILVVLILAILLARPVLAKKGTEITLIVVIDRSESVPQELQKQARALLKEAFAYKGPGDQLAVIDVAELASIQRLPGTDMLLDDRNTSLSKQQSDLASGIRMAMAIAPPDTATRILLVSDGNETSGDLREAARNAGANGIPVDVLPLQYNYSREVVFKRLAAPSKARSGQTVTLRFILGSTAKASGTLMLTLNDRIVDLDPTSGAVGVAIDLKPGTNVKTVSIPLGTLGMHEFEAVFVPDDPSQDRLSQNNRASAMTFVAGPGHVLVLDSGDRAGEPLAEALRQANIDVRYAHVSELTTQLTKLMDVDAIVLANTDATSFTYQQQEMLRRYVTDLGGGLVMVGGPDTFGAGGWIGSPLAEILPVDLDPPQKKQMPKGALVLIMHACEMPNGNFWGKSVAIAAVKSLSRLDLVGVLNYAWKPGDSNWVYPLSPVGDKKAIISAINQMQMGDMPDFGAPMEEAYLKLKSSDAAQKHMIIISDGDPQPPSNALLADLKAAGNTCTGVAVLSHSPADVQSLMRIAKVTGGRFYNVKDPKTLPQIFIKEAQVIRRSLIIEETFTPQVTYSFSEILRGVGSSVPALDGYVRTGRKAGLSQMVLSSSKGDPILATGQAGLGRCLAFTSSADSRWASQWLQWGGFGRFWEQAIRWVGKSSLASDCEIFADVRGREVTLTVESIDPAGEFVQFANINGQIIAPDMKSQPLELTQVGPGRYRAKFRAQSSGSYLVNLRYKKTGDQAGSGVAQSAINVPYAPEFRDLSDNLAILTDVAAATGGRIISTDPQQANLFDRTGLKFPQTASDLTTPLIIIWLVLFLLDVAVRRVALDVKAIAARVVSALRIGKPSRERSETLERLQASRKRFQRQSKGKEPLASKRFEAGEKQVADLPIAQEPSKASPPGKQKPPKASESKPQDQQEQTHLQRLLKAKRQARDDRQKSSQDDNQGD